MRLLLKGQPAYTAVIFEHRRLGVRSRNSRSGIGLGWGTLCKKLSGLPARRRRQLPAAA